MERVFLCVLAGISKYYLSSAVPSAVTMATSTGFSSSAALKNANLKNAGHIPVNSFYSAGLLSTLSAE